MELLAKPRIKVNSFDVVICSQSFQHYPNPQDFFTSVHKVLRPGGRLILRDNTGSDILIWLINHIEIPLVHLVGHGRFEDKEYISHYKEISKVA